MLQFPSIITDYGTKGQMSGWTNRWTKLIKSHVCNQKDTPVKLKAKKFASMKVPTNHCPGQPIDAPLEKFKQSIRYAI